MLRAGPPGDSATLNDGKKTVVVTRSPPTHVAWEGMGWDVKGRTVGKLEPSWVLGRKQARSRSSGWENEVGRGMAVKLGELQGPVLGAKGLEG